MGAERLHRVGDSVKGYGEGQHDDKGKADCTVFH